MRRPSGPPRGRGATGPGCARAGSAAATDRLLEIRQPAGVGNERARALPGPDPVGDDLVSDPQRARGPRRSSGQAPVASSGRLVTPKLGSPRRSLSCSARLARRGWSRPLAFTTTRSGWPRRADSAASSSGPSRRASRPGSYGAPAGPRTVLSPDSPTDAPGMSSSAVLGRNASSANRPCDCRGAARGLKHGRGCIRGTPGRPGHACGLANRDVGRRHDANNDSRAGTRSSRRAEDPI